MLYERDLRGNYGLGPGGYPRTIPFLALSIIYGSLLISIGRNPSQRDELLRYAFIGFSLVEVSGLIGLVISLLLLFGFDRFQ